ncbi:MAG: diguanylate cyclase [Nitrospirota bacterium]|nr:diguanylate cyclase [Nitrospirota bacterium]
MFRKLINFITFVDLPIRKKFLLFSLGVLFWFVTMFVVSIAANFVINNHTDMIMHQVIPVDKVMRKITRKLQSLNNDAAELSNISDITTLNQRTEISRARIMDLRSFISVLVLGGQVNDINRDTDKLIESLSVVPSDGAMDAKKYSNSMKPLLEAMYLKLTEIASLKAKILNNKLQNDQLAEKINEYRALISSSKEITIKYSADISESYIATLGKTKEITRLTLFLFTGVLMIATALLIIFTITISNSIAILVNSIIEQIKSLGAGKVDLTKKIAIRSKDEIGVLSEEFNTLTEEIYDVVMFKKVIEEDDSLEDVYSRLGKAFSDKLGLNNYIIYEIPDNHNTMKPAYPILLNNKEIFCNEDILINCNLCKVKKTGHMISSIAYPDICKQFRSDLNKDHICIPMIIGGKTGGVVQFLFDKHDHTIDRKDKRLFKAEQYIKESLSVIEAKRLTNTLRESALKDSLTNLYNRRFLQEYTETLVSGVLRREKVVGLIMCDLDFFKQVNDHYGHNVGDAVLKETAEVIKKCVRTSDLVIRFGGEEFLVLLLDINEGDTMKTAEKIREAIEATKIKVSDGTIKKTISLGISEFPIDTESFWQAIKFADVALYKAKETGRNKSVKFDKEMWGEDGF